MCLATPTVTVTFAIAPTATTTATTATTAIFYYFYCHYCYIGSVSVNRV
jgi:hypothetical protein